MKYKTIDLFAGIGGIRKAFELTYKFENVLSAEIDFYACETYRHLYDEDPYNDVTSEKFKKKVEKTEYDVLLAGFPCQAFSIAGKKEGFLDKTRGTLFFDIADILDRTRPKAFLLENVEGLLRHKKGQTIKIILETLVKDLNYYVIGVDENPITGDLVYSADSLIRNSKNFGVPQNRPRVYLMGFNRDYYNDFLLELPVYELPRERKEKPIYQNLNDLLELNADPEYFLASGYLDTLKKHRERHKNKGNGYGYVVVNSTDKEDPIANAILATGGSGKERNLVYDPKEGIAGMKVKGKKTPLNNEGIRMMTPREWGKLQGFIEYAFVENGVDKFSFPESISKTQQYKLFGNAVTIPVVEEMAKIMGECLDFLENAILKSEKQVI